MTSRIFALAKNQTPRPLALLVEELRQFTPPNKTPELQAFAEARRVAGENQIAATKALGELLAKARAGEDTGRQHVNPAEIRAAEREVTVADGALITAREREQEAGLAWRRQYARALTDAVGPARHALHDLVTELDAALSLFKTLAREATAAGVGQNWIVREAPSLLDHLTVIREHLDMDRKIS